MSESTTWDGEQWAKPLVFLKKNTVAELILTQNYQLTDDIADYLPTPQTTGETFLRILYHSGKTEAAVELMCHLLLPRVSIWWALRCYHIVKKDIRLDFEKDGLTPEQRRKKKVNDLVEQFSDTSEIDQMVEDHKKVMGEYAKNVEKQLKEKGPLSPIEVVARKMDEFQSAMEAIGIEFPAPDAPLSPQAQVFKARAKEALMKEIEKKMAPFIPPSTPPVIPPELERVSGDRIFEKIKEKTDAINPAIDKEMAKYFPLKLRGLPQKASQAKKDAALMAAQRWLLAPTDDNGNLACQAGVEAQNGPEAMLAFTAFWCSTNLKTETGLVPTNPALPPLGISKTLLQLALLEGGEKDYDARYEEFLNIGIDCANGTSTWDAYGHEVKPHAAPPAQQSPEKDMLLSRSGFGRA